MYICTQITTNKSNIMGRVLEMGRRYRFNSRSGESYTGEYLGKNDMGDILMRMSGDHPFNVGGDGVAIFYLSVYFFFRYFSPELIAEEL